LELIATGEAVQEDGRLSLLSAGAVPSDAPARRG